MKIVLNNVQTQKVFFGLSLLLPLPEHNTGLLLICVGNNVINGSKLCQRTIQDHIRFLLLK
ncbi:hypothetical protein RO3G_05529 [Rhizopus delemar RA 99-880]|uniref:Uncharacterized protein n=1 Tax=Rhizopus delemar (strain RA 99-880 / ATCC MYA-4621 / FGSC 9543 / NRRL 43880) TaxID=246409 RepID=I1BX94_RHIO9|nr:hypothetical protein RO3G_05529 [Rhizopus delemar RA 99-880]|eukprot:EIE80824.1 hypothetical protein RO3G_05529 [Rhizopus delemar RA 99-880]